ncbi:MAG: hypothetical protein JWR35_2219 [Marmoricola sp.]|nr:hypothetical protein [Marmoricola sp.]
MTSSGMKRGLAVAAVSAMTFAGIPLLAQSAHASDLVNVIPADTVQFRSALTIDGSTKFDGNDSLIHLVASAGTHLGAPIQQVQFSFSVNSGGTYTPIPGGLTTRSNGGFSAYWNPPASAINKPAGVVRVKVEAYDAGPSPIIGANQNFILPITNTDESVDLAGTEGDQLGYHAYGAGPKTVVVHGTTSDVTPGVTVSSRLQTTGGFAGGAASDIYGSPSGTSRTWSGLVSLGGYALGGADEVTINSDADGESDDAELYHLYSQTITNATTNTDASGNLNVPVPPTGVGDTQNVTITVTDQNGKPVGGATVYNEDPIGISLNPFHGFQGANTVKTTKSDGTVTFTVPAPLIAFPQTYHFVVNEGVNNTSYDTATDIRKTVTVKSYAPVATTASASSVDGPALDFDENGPNDFPVVVKDQLGNPRTGEQVGYTWTVVPFDTTEPTATTVPLNAGATDSTGTASPTLPVVGNFAPGTYPGGLPSGTYTLNAYINIDGLPPFSAAGGDIAANAVTVKVGQAAATWDGGTNGQAPSSATTVFKGKLLLEDGTPLVGRKIQTDWTKSIQPGSNAIIAAQADQPAGTTRVSDSVAQMVTGADGGFATALTDPTSDPRVDEPTPVGVNRGTLVATTLTTPGIGNAGVSNSERTLNVQFLKNYVSTVIVPVSGDSPVLFFAGPGRPTRKTYTVRNSDGVALAGIPVTLTTDHGFFTPNPNASPGADGTDFTTGLTPATAPSAGDLYGDWKNLGTTETLITDASGQVSPTVAIERDAGFDDDGVVTAKVVATVGSVSTSTSNNTSITFSTVNSPLNPSTISLDLAEAAKQTVGVLPKAPARTFSFSNPGETVSFRLVTTDQFGNRTAQANAGKLSDGVAGAVINPAATPTSGTDTDQSGEDATNPASTPEFTNDNPAVTSRAYKTVNQTITAAWTNDTNKWKDSDPALSGFQQGRDRAINGATLTDAAPTVNWYTVDYAHSVFTLTHTGGNVQPVHTAVTENYKAVDQNGEPISGFAVDFLRDGPETQSGDQNNVTVTDDNGLASYIYQGAVAGSAHISAALGLTTFTFPTVGFVPIPESLENDVVTFGAGSTGKTTIHPTLTAHNGGGGNDIIRVYAHTKDAHGAKVAIHFGGRVVRGTLNSVGQATFIINDANKNASRNFYAVIGSTSHTKSGISNHASIK